MKSRNEPTQQREGLTKDEGFFQNAGLIYDIDKTGHCCSFHLISYKYILISIIPQINSN